MIRARRILHASDFSRASRQAFSVALDLAKQNKAELILVHVLSPVTPYLADDQYTGASVYPEIEAAQKQEAQAGMRALMAAAQKARVKARALLLKGVAHERIVRAAKNRRADLIVVGTHGRTGLSKFFMGSVAGRVVATAHCPVLTVRGK
jgi:nucleotide-binding universal stress UspA family protein